MSKLVYDTAVVYAINMAVERYICGGKDEFIQSFDLSANLASYTQFASFVRTNEHDFYHMIVLKAYAQHSEDHIVHINYELIDIYNKLLKLKAVADF